MIPKQAIFGLNLILSLSGLRLFTTGRSERIFQKFMAIVLLLAVYYEGFNYLVTLRRTSRNSLTTMAQLTTYSVVLLFYHRMLLQRIKIQSFVQSLMGNMPLTALKKIRKWSMLAALIFFIESVINMVGLSSITTLDQYNATSSSRYYMPAETPFIITALVIGSIQHNIAVNYENLSVSIYLLMFIIRSISLKNYGAVLLIKLEEKSFHLHNEIKRLHHVKSLINEFESLFSYIPSIWLSVHMLTLPGLLSFLASAEGGHVDKKFRTILLGKEWFSIARMFGLFLLCDWKQQQIKSLFESIVDKIEEDHFSPQSMVYVKKLKALSEMEPTASSVFTINKSLILSFMGTVLTFTVLFIQMQQDKNMNAFNLSVKNQTNC